MGFGALRIGAGPDELETLTGCSVSIWVGWGKELVPTGFGGVCGQIRSISTIPIGPHKFDCAVGLFVSGTSGDEGEFRLHHVQLPVSAMDGNLDTVWGQNLSVCTMHLMAGAHTGTNELRGT